MAKSGLCGLVAMLAMLASAMTPGGSPKKFVGLFFDVMDATPSNVLANADQFAEQAPYLDGVAIGLHDVPVVAGDGGCATGRLHTIMHPTERWTRDSVRDQLPFLKAISMKPNLGSSFLVFWMTPGVKGVRLDWTDDKAWANYAENMATVAWLAKEGGMKGLMLDPEEYGAQGGSLTQYIITQRDPPFGKCANLARKRGREVFSRVFEEFPDAVLFFLWTMEHQVRHFAVRGVTDPLQMSDDAGELLPYFYNGMLDVMPPGARFVDGAEHYSLTSLKDMYWKGALNQLVGARPFVAPENWGKYRAQLLVGNTHYLDMFSTRANPRSHWYHGPVDGSRLEHLRRNLVQSLEVADEYVWLYGEGGRLIDWRGASGKRQSDKIPLWEEQIPGLSETLEMAKDPDELMEKRKRECAAKGTLKNLADVSCKLPAVFSLEDKPVAMSVKQPPSVKGVRPGELYSVGQRYRYSLRQGAPLPRVTWRKGGKPVADKASVVLKPEPVDAKGWQWARALATVPDGADELVVDLSADLFPGDTVSASGTEVFKLDEAPDAEELARTAAQSRKPVARPAGKRSKWSYDEAAKMLTDGNWTLKATFPRGDKSGKTLAVNGVGATGSGVLDLSGVEADTGKRVTSIEGFTRNQEITGLFGPDIVSVGSGALRFCNSLKSVVLSPDVAFLNSSCFAGSTNLVHFSPTVFKPDACLRENAFNGCTSLVGDFSYEGTNAIRGALFMGTSITSFRAPRCHALETRAFSGCLKLRSVVFACDKTFKDDAERAEFMRAERGKGGLLGNLVPKNRQSGELKAQKRISVSLPRLPSRASFRVNSMVSAFP